jgi:4'-phosphopantetheinyl transferase
MVSRCCGTQLRISDSISLTTREKSDLLHSEDLAACAVTWDREIGLDIEKVRTIPDVSGIARIFFSAHEREGLARLPANMRNLAFLNFWTRKEAYLKAVGKGLSVPLTRFDVASLPQASDAVRGTRIEPCQGSLWLMREMKSPKNSAARWLLKERIGHSK